MSQHTEGVKHYGVTTDAAKAHVETMLASGVWEDLTGFDRACIAELVAEIADLRMLRECDARHIERLCHH